MPSHRRIRMSVARVRALTLGAAALGTVTIPSVASAAAKPAASTPAPATTKSSSSTTTSSTKSSATTSSATTLTQSSSYANNLDGWIKQAQSILSANGYSVSYNAIYQTAMHESAG